MSKVLILGGGLTGLITAELLKEYSPVIIEKTDRVGGMAKTFRRGPFFFEYGGHYLHFQENESFEFFKKFSGELIERKRNSFVLIEDKFVKYPVQIFFPEAFPLYKEQILEHQKNKKIDKTNYLTYLKSSFGEILFEKFFYPYNKKFWKTDLETIDPKWSERYIPQTDENKIKNPPEDIGYNKIFYYPKNGIQYILDNLAKDKEIHLNTVVKKIDVKKKTVITNNGNYNYEVLVSTIPMEKLVRISDLGLYEMDYLSILILNMGMRGEIDKDFSWLYLPDDSTPFFRVGKYILPDSEGIFGLYFELSHKGEYPKVETLFLEARKLMRTIGVKGKALKALILNLKYAYPIMKIKDKAYTEMLLDQLSNYSIFPAGRMGRWKYLTMEDSYFEAIRIKKIVDLFFK